MQQIFRFINIQGALKRHGQNLGRYSPHQKEEKILYEHGSGVMLKILLSVLLTQEAI